jgi:hypothetical protein
MNHLLIAQKLADRADVPRSSLINVETATGEVGLVVDWAQNALLDIQTQERGKWNFLHNEFSKTLKPSKTLNLAAATDNGSGLVGLPSTSHGFIAGDVITVLGTTNYDGSYTAGATTSTDSIVITAIYAAETFLGSEQAFIKDYEFYTVNGIQSFDVDTFKYYKKSDGPSYKSHLSYLAYSEFVEKSNDYSSTSDPIFITVTPTKSIRVWPAPDDTFVVCAEAFRKPQSMTANTDIPILPENFHMMIVWKGLIDYAGFEESGAIFKYASIQFDAFYTQLVWQERYERADDRVIRVE